MNVCKKTQAHTHTHTHAHTHTHTHTHTSYRRLNTEQNTVLGKQFEILETAKDKGKF